MTNTAPPAIILFAHGARDPEWARPIEALRKLLMQRRPGADIRTAFLEFMSPTLEAALDEVASSGTRHITIVPVFLAQGGHLKRDLPNMLERARARHPEVTLQLTGTIGEQDEVIAAMASAIEHMRSS
jgi:sirohydrochlorin cobaltochelatase